MTEGTNYFHVDPVVVGKAFNNLEYIVLIGIVITPKPSQATATQPKSNPKQLAVVGCGNSAFVLEQYRPILTSAILTNHNRLS